MIARLSLPTPRALSLTMLALLSSCASVPKLGPAPKMAPPSHYAANRSFSSATPAAWPASDWWTAYGDPQLDGLIAEALAGSPDIKAAAARVRQADALAQQAGAARLPTVDLNGNAAATKQSYNNGVPAAFVPRGWNDTGKLAVNLSFDLDLWGANRAAYAAAHSEAEAAALDYSQSALLLSTNIADAYADLARLFAERSVQVQALELRTRTTNLTADRVASGLDTQAELKLARSAVPTAREQLASTDEQIGLTRNRLAALLGEGPDRGLLIQPPTVQIEARDIPADATTDLIGRRPDIQAAKARVEAQAKRIKVARAAFYPSVNLTAVLGFQSFGLGNLFKSGSSFGNVSPAISLPIFHGGEIQGRYRGARANYDESVAIYDRTVTDAYRAVADAVTSRRALAVRIEQSQLALDESNGAYAVAKQRYAGGLSTFLDVLTAQDRALDALRTVADLKARAFTLDVALVRALGGGFDAAPQPTSKDDHHG